MTKHRWIAFVLLLGCLSVSIASDLDLLPCKNFFGDKDGFHLQFLLETEEKQIVFGEEDVIYQIGEINKTYSVVVEKPGNLKLAFKYNKNGETYMNPRSTSITKEKWSYFPRLLLFDPPKQGMQHDYIVRKHWNLFIVYYNTPLPSTGSLFTSSCNERRMYFPQIAFSDFHVEHQEEEPIKPNSNITLFITISIIPPEKAQYSLGISQSLEIQSKKLGLGDQEMKEAMELLKNPPWILFLTGAVSLLHIIFEVMAMVEDVSFWKKTKSLQGVSRNSILYSCISEIVVFLYLMENDTSQLVLIPLGINVCIEMWKVAKIYWWVDNKDVDLFTEQSDKQAFAFLSRLLFPPVLCVIFGTLFFYEQTGWYSWFVNSLYSIVFAAGFIRMTPQIYINYRLKSVVRMSFRPLAYRALNTFIDDLFAFVIKMPTMHRLSCFRDDIVFLILLYQLYAYRKREDPHEH